MSQQTIRQRARRAAREAAGKRQRERAERERRLVATAERVMVALGERDAKVAQAEMSAAEALRELTEREGLSLSEAVEWCAGAVSLREAARLRRLVGEPRPEDPSALELAAAASAGTETTTGTATKTGEDR